MPQTPSRSPRRTTSSNRSARSSQAPGASQPADEQTIGEQANGEQPSDEQEWLAEVAELSFQEARTALELAMAHLQSDSLEVEEMAGLYRRAEAYAKRCEAVLQQVEQDVIEWSDDASPTAP